jgi:acetyl esterase/lipase
MTRTPEERLAPIRRVLSRHGFAGKAVARVREEERVLLSSGTPLSGVTAQPFALGGIRAEIVRPAAAASDGLVLYVHGGGFFAGSVETHRKLAAHIARSGGVPVLTFDYALAPEHPYPAALDDTLAVWRRLRADGYGSRNVVFGGDSAGAGLALMALLALRDAGEELPAGAFLLSPFVDYTRMDSETYRTNAGRDPFVSLDGNRMCVEAFFRPAIPEGFVSPVDRDLSGLPPLLIQAGGDEVLLGEIGLLARRAADRGVPVTFGVWEGMWHVFQMLANVVGEGREAVEGIASFIRGRIGTAG